MKKMLVKENIEFKRGQDSKKGMQVGTYSDEYLESNFFNKLRRVHPESIDKIKENPGPYINALHNLETIGIDPGAIRIIQPFGGSDPEFAIPAYRVIQGNTVSNLTITEEDAQQIIDSISKYDIDKDPDYLRIDADSSRHYMDIQDLKDFWRRRGWEWID